MSSVSFMSFLLKAFALLWRELDNVGFMGFLRLRMFTLNLVVVLFWQISCLENYVTKIYESFFLDCLQQCPASLLTGGDKIRCMGALLDIIGQPVWPELFRMFVLFADFLQNISQPRSFSSAWCVKSQFWEPGRIAIHRRTAVQLKFRYARTFFFK